MAPTAADVPYRYDVVLNSQGYVFDRTIDPTSLRHFTASQHEYTPTFIPRQNLSGSYGDEQQDFWMTMSQADWSRGEQQKYIRVNDAESKRHYWQGSNVDVLIEGQVGLSQAAKDYNPSNTVQASCNWRGAVGFVANGTLYTCDYADTISSRGSIASTFTGITFYGLCSDAVNIYAAYPDAAGGAIRKWNGSTPVGASTDFSTFSSGLGIHSIEFLNNTLYGTGVVNGGYLTLYSFSTAGAATTIYAWEPADGGTYASAGAAPKPSFSRLRAFGNKLLLLKGNELFEYDGVSPSKIAELPATFYATDICVVEGVVFIGGAYIKRDAANIGSALYNHRGAVFFYVDGSLNELWKADTYTTGTGLATSDLTPFANVVPYGAGVLFWDSTRSQLTFYDMETGSVSGVCDDASTKGIGAGCGFAWFNGYDATHASQYPNPATRNSTGYVRTSLFDADSSVPKYWKSVKVDADIPTGGSIDISYRVNDLDSTYTSVQTAAVSGTEYALNVSGRSISIKVTLNNGSSASPVVKRIYVRGTPLQDTFRRDTFILDCTGKFEGDSPNPVRLRNGEHHPLTGLQMATNLRTAAALTTPFTVVDEFGSYTGLIEPDSFRLERVSDREYRAYLTVRQV